MIGTAILNEDTMHEKSGGCEGSLLGRYIRRVNASRALNPPWEIKDMVAVEILRELVIGCKIFRQSEKHKMGNHMVGGGDTTEYAGGRNCLLYSMLGKNFSLDKCINFYGHYSRHA